MTILGFGLPWTSKISNAITIDVIASENVDAVMTPKLIIRKSLSLQVMF